MTASTNRDTLVARLDELDEEQITLLTEFIRADTQGQSGETAQRLASE